MTVASLKRLVPIGQRTVPVDRYEEQYDVTGDGQNDRGTVPVDRSPGSSFR